MSEKYRSYWVKYYNNDSKHNKNVEAIFSNWENNKDDFLKSPKITNEGIEFSLDFGYSNLNPLTIDLIITKIMKLQNKHGKIFLAVEQGVSSKIKDNIVRILKQYGNAVYAYSESDKYSEISVRQAFLATEFVGGFYIHKNITTNKWNLKVFNSTGNLVSIDSLKKLVSNLNEFFPVISYHSEYKINELSLNKITSHSYQKLDPFNYFSNFNPIKPLSVYINSKDNHLNFVLDLAFKNSKISIDTPLTKKSFFTKYDYNIDINKDQSISITYKKGLSKIEVKQDYQVFFFLETMFSIWKDRLDSINKVAITPEVSEFIKQHIENLDLTLVSEFNLHNENEVVWSFGQNTFSSGLAFNFCRDNITFLMFLITILAQFKDNDLLEYKINYVESNFDKYDYITDDFRFDISLIEEFKNVFIVGQNFTKQTEISNVENIYTDHKKIYYLQKITLSDGSYVKIWFDKKTNKLTLKIESKKVHLSKIKNAAKLHQVYNRAEEAIATIMKRLKVVEQN
ncbi:MAG5620 family putative phospho-sugar mutase [Mycoplasma sp. Ms02]|uniref:MAG5620 family putative phospho-sugar mutase n=1 Tax=Mycoplasma sp. Ms02 TaxID=353851 RepID=UPI001C8AB5DC|nr:hypothetical protein [Mycoplasma sp. Ms02]QZE12102.1 hypothetical protein K4L35_01965 [Mycoplasma sp. Ms02]